MKPPLPGEIRQTVVKYFDSVPWRLLRSLSSSNSNADGTQLKHSTGRASPLLHHSSDFEREEIFEPPAIPWSLFVFLRGEACGCSFHENVFGRNAFERSVEWRKTSGEKIKAMKETICESNKAIREALTCSRDVSA